MRFLLVLLLLVWSFPAGAADCYQCAIEDGRSGQPPRDSGNRDYMDAWNQGRAEYEPEEEEEPQRSRRWFEEEEEDDEE